MSATIYLVRHAQSHPKFNVPHSDWALSDRGSTQARDLAGLLSGLGIERIYSSPFTRCMDTIQPFASKHGLPITQVENLRERYIAPKLIDDFITVWERSWRDFDYVLPGCESSRVAQRRFADAIATITAENMGRTIAVSTHGNVMGLFLNHIDSANGIKEAEMLRNPDVLRIVATNDGYTWDRSFTLAGLKDVATAQEETPLELDDTAGR